MCELLPDIKAVIAATFAVPIDSIPDDGSGETVEHWDSIGHINLMLALEERFEVSFTMDEIMHLRDVGAICTVIADKVGKPA